MCYELLVGKAPFDSQDVDETYRKIKSCDIRFDNCISKGAQDLICRVRIPLIFKRFFWNFLRNFNLLFKLLIINPNERLTAKEVMTHPWILKYAN